MTCSFLPLLFSWWFFSWTGVFLWACMFLLNFKLIIVTIRKGFKNLGFIKRNIKIFTPVIGLRTLNSALFWTTRGHCLWHPYLATGVYWWRERVQNTFLSHVAPLFSIPITIDVVYSFMWSILNISILSSCRHHDADLNFIPSPLNGSLDAPCLLFLMSLSVFHFTSSDIVFSSVSIYWYHIV